MSNLHRGPSINASYQVSVHLAMRFQRRIFFKIGQSETRIACGGHVCYWIGTKCFSLFGLGVSEEKIKMWKVTDDGRQVMAKAHFAFSTVS